MKKDSKTKYQMTKAFKIFLYFLPLLLLIYAFAIWYFYSDGKVVVNKYIQTNILKVEQEEVETITYTSSVYRIGFSYPKGWTVKESTEGIFVSSNDGRYVGINYPNTSIGLEEYAVQKLNDYKEEIHSNDATLSLQPINIWYGITSYEYFIIDINVIFPDYTGYFIQSDYNIVDIKTSTGEIEKDIVTSIRFLSYDQPLEGNNAKDFDISKYSDIKLKDYSNLSVYNNLDSSWPLHVGYCKSNTWNYCLTILNKDNLGNNEDRNVLENFEKTRDDILNSKLFVGAPEIFQFGNYEGQILISEIKDLQIPNIDAYIATASLGFQNSYVVSYPKGEWIYLEIYAVSGNNLLKFEQNGSTSEMLHVSDEENKSCIISIPDRQDEYDNECFIKLLNTPKYKQEIRNRFEEMIKVFELE